MYSAAPVVGERTRQTDVALIEKTVARLERAQQAEDVAAFMRLFGADPVWVTAHGKRLIGRSEISEFTRKVLPGAMKDSKARYEIAHVAFPRPDVAVVNVNQIPITLDGQRLQGEPEGRPVYVMTKEHGEWLITAGQNTQVRAA